MSATVLHRKVVSHYPAHLSRSLISDLDRFYLPADGIESYRDAHILWTVIDSRMTGIPNHFVLILPMICFPYKGREKLERKRNNTNNNISTEAEVDTNDEKGDMGDNNAEGEESDVHAGSAEQEAQGP